MLQNKRFNVAIAISALWHLFWMSIIRVGLLPTEISVAKFPAVVFLGPILEESAFEVGIEKELTSSSSDKRRANSLDSRFTRIDLPRRTDFEETVPLVQPEKSTILPGDISEEIKDIPKYSLGKVSVSYGKPPEIEGPLHDRAILYKPQPPEYPDWAEEIGLDFDVELRLLVASDGRVQFAEPLISSGFPAIDCLGVRYMRGWRFVPLDEGKNQWGTIKLNFRLE